MRRGNGGPDALDQRRLHPGVSLTRFDLRGDRDGFGLDVESEGRNGSQADCGSSSFDGQFDVVRIAFRPRTIMTSLIRPVTKSSPS